MLTNSGKRWLMISGQSTDHSSWLTLCSSTWLPGVITALHGLLTYDMKLGDGTVVRRHSDHVQSRASHFPPTETDDDCLPGPTTVSPGPSGAGSGPAAPQTEL